MPANLTPQYFKAEEAYRRARTDADKLAALREMHSAIPKHKGTEKLQADIKRRIAQLRATAGRKGGAHRASGHMVERSGAAQVALVGAPNSGKSRLVADLTAADPEVADYPFTTWTPTPGIALVDKIPLQLVDLPPLNPGHVEPWLLDLVRNADLLLVLLDLGSDDLLEHWDDLQRALAHCRVVLGEAPPPEAREIGTRYKKAVIGGGRADRRRAPGRLTVLYELVGDLDVHPFSLETGEGLQELLREVVKRLALIRVYTKIPHQEADLDEPFVFPRGFTVADAARTIHKDLADHLKFARAWGPRFHAGQPVGRDMELEDGDILEFHE